MRKISLVFFVFLMATIPLKAQDILASISVSASGAEGTDRGVYDAMQKSLTDLVNGRAWTPYQVKPDERIRIRMSINISNRISDTEFRGSINVAMGRTIFNTNYESPVLNFMDNDLHFYYNQYEPMEYVENVFTNNLVAVVAFYIYYGLGMEFDSFQPSGGQDFFAKAKGIVQSAQSASEKGWNSTDSDRSRYWLVENIMNPAYRSLRSFSYQYHRQGLDIMADNIENGRTYVVRALEDLRKAYEERPGLYMTQMVIDTKRDEIINIFSPASDSEKATIVVLMKRIDASNSTRYDAINAGTSSNQNNTNDPGTGFDRSGTGTTGTQSGTGFGTYRP